MHPSSAKIAVDVMGSDMGPGELIAGIELALGKFPDLAPLCVIGDEGVTIPLLKKAGLFEHPKISTVHAPQVIEMDEKPIQSLKQKKDSSMVVGLELVKSGECSGLLSCGNTGSLMAGGTLKLRTMPGVERPALSSVSPSKDHNFIILDVGANPDTEPRQLVHNAIMGSHHCRVELNSPKPKVGLLSIGTEEGKGTDRITETHRYLKNLDGLINYTGLIEGFHVFEKDVDVVVTDGFVGNILGKTCESLFSMLKDVFVEELTKNTLRKIGAGLSIGAFKSIKEKFNPDRYGAAPFLGLKSLVVKAHGSSNRYLIMNALKSTNRMLSHDMNDAIQRDVAIANEKMNALET